MLKTRKWIEKTCYWGTLFSLSASISSVNVWSYLLGEGILFSKVTDIPHPFQQDTSAFLFLLWMTSTVKSLSRTKKKSPSILFKSAQIPDRRALTVQISFRKWVKQLPTKSRLHSLKGGTLGEELLKGAKMGSEWVSSQRKWHSFSERRLLLPGGRMLPTTKMALSVATSICAGPQLESGIRQN